jgi:hypothetical protein
MSSGRRVVSHHGQPYQKRFPPTNNYPGKRSKSFDSFGTSSGSQDSSKARLVKLGPPPCCLEPNPSHWPLVVHWKRMAFVCYRTKVAGIFFVRWKHWPFFAPRFLLCLKSPGFLGKFWNQGLLCLLQKNEKCPEAIKYIISLSEK